MSAADVLISLLDSYWFGHNILGQKVKLPSNLFVAKQEEEEEEETKLSNIASNLQIRSISARFLRYEPTSPPFKDYPSPKLQKIDSGKEISELSKDEIVKNEQNRHVKRKKRLISNSRRKGLISRSLSDLEYEEVKGFMDLGFVFSEEDKDSRLVSIIPGLQRYGLKKNEKENEKIVLNDECQEGSVSRPYLSEAWEVLEKRKANRELSKWKLPRSDLVDDESNIKNHLKAWAHTVASTVR